MNKALDLLLTPNLVVSVSGRRSASPAYLEHSAEQLGLWIDRLRPDVVMSGMALGVDTLAAEIAIDRDRKLHAVVPGEWQPNRWNEANRLHWRELLSQAWRLTVVDKSEALPSGDARRYVVKAFAARNLWMAEHSSLTIVCWDGVIGGGTYNMLGDCLQANQAVLLVQPGHNTRLLCDNQALARAIQNRAHSGPVEATESMVAVA